MHLQEAISQLGYTVVGPFATGEETIHSTTDISIVFLTGFSQDGLLVQTKMVAPYGYLIKPVPERELVATLDF